jgi:ankyrin repeat protein
MKGDERYEHHIYEQEENIPFMPEGAEPAIGRSSANVVVDKIKGRYGPYKDLPYVRKIIMLDEVDSNDLEAIKDEIEKEAKILQKAQHSHVIGLIMTYWYQKRFAIIMDRAEGNLGAHLKIQGHHKNISQWFGCLMGVTAHIHKINIQHRDIKPANILVKEEKIFLADFGISKVCLGKTLSTTYNGRPRSRTVNFCAPEVEEGGTRSRSADIFSLGAVFLEMLVAHYPEKDDELKNILKSNSDKTNSYAQKVDQVQEFMNTLEQDVQQVRWHSTILFLCQRMLQREQNQRPKADDLYSWWKLKSSATATQSVDCNCCPLSDYPQHHNSTKLSESLRKAYENGHSLMVKLLEEMGAQISDDNKLAAAFKGRLWETVKLLLQGKANAEATNKALVNLFSARAIVEAKDEYNQTPLLNAAMYGNEFIVGLLLDKSACTEAKDGYGQTALLRAAEGGHNGTVKLLLNKGADIEAKGNDGNTPLLRAAERGHDKTVKLLLGRHADIEAKGDDGNTPLLRVVKRGHKKTVTLLLDNGADIEAKDNDGKTPLSWAINEKYEEIESLLRTYPDVARRRKWIARLVKFLGFGLIIFFLL